MRPEPRLDLGDDLLADERRDEGRRLGRGRVAVPPPAVLGVETELAADRLAVGHEDPRAPSHRLVEAVHAPAALGARRLEVGRGREEPVVRAQ